MRDETSIEKQLKKVCESCGFSSHKFLSHIKGDPDRIVFTSGRSNLQMFFVETKDKDGILSKHQIERIKYWRERHYLVFVLRTKEEIDTWIPKIESLLVQVELYQKHKKELGELLR